MPYINQELRDSINELLPKDLYPMDGGELQYIIALLIDRYYEIQCSGRPRYKDMETMMGALQGAALEHYRCIVAPYEDKKILENGGVYGDYTRGRGY